MSSAREPLQIAEGGGLALEAEHVRWTGIETRLLRTRDSAVRRGLALADVGAIASSLALVIVVFGSGGSAWRQLLLGLAALPLWIVLFKTYGLYDRDAKRVGHSTVDDVPWLFHALLVGTLGLYGLMRVPVAARLTAQESLGFFVVVFTLVLVARASVREIVSNSIRFERLLVVGGGPMASLLVEKVQRNRGYGLEAIAYLGEPTPGIALPHAGDVTAVEQVCRSLAAERVLFVAPALDDETLEDLLRRTSKLNVKIGILPHVVDALGPSVVVDHVQGVTVLGISPPELSSSSWFLKRTMDLLIASTVLILSLPLLVLIAFSVKVSSPGPVLFGQERVGRGGQRFRIWKFRTMVQDAEAQEERLKAQSAHSVWLLLEHDPRVTPLGRFLRHTSLDELPQLWNVVVGDMSLVGPRPMPPTVDDQIEGWRRRRLDLTPGVTGLWQVLGRIDIAFEEMLKLDYLYVTNWSLWQDVRLLVQTLPAVLRRKGVN